MSKSDPLAEKIARLLESEAKTPDIASLFASIEKINRRLEKLETSSNPQSEIRNPQSGGFCLPIQKAYYFDWHSL